MKNVLAANVIILTRFQIEEDFEEEQTTKESLEETFALELSNVKESHDRSLDVANDFE